MTNSPLVLDGKSTSLELKNQAQKEALEFSKKTGNSPSLAVVLVGADPASQVYVKSKVKACQEFGFASKLIELEASTTQDQLLQTIEILNGDDKVDGILVQLPLPKHIDPHVIADAIRPDKDADCLSSANQGLLFRGQARVEPCTPSGVIRLLKKYKIEMAGKHAVVLGRSEIVGKPMVHLLLNENASVTWLHSKSKNTEALLKSADIVVAAVGVPNLFKMSQFKKGVVLVDVGIHRNQDGLCGDIDFTGVEGVASAYTPVPGGVGPLTIAMLLQNTLHLAKQRKNLL